MAWSDYAVEMSRSDFVSAFVIIAALLAPAARSGAETLPPVGGVSSPAGAMIFYLARGQEGACGPNCSEWIAAEGVVQWDTFKRLLAFMERLGGRKVPVVLNVWGEGNLNVATTLGKIIRDRGLDVSAGTTVVAGCEQATEAACFALKRGGKPLDASIDISSVACDVVCVLMLAGGVHRILPADAKVVIGPTQIRNRLSPNVSEAHRQGLQAHYGDQYGLYLTQMGVRTEVVDMIDGIRKPAAPRSSLATTGCGSASSPGSRCERRYWLRWSVRASANADANPTSYIRRTLIFALRAAAIMASSAVASGALSRCASAR